ncbi:MAG: hypothetical protein IJ060_12295 [Oscillospiraceae bacterium]|nr:hypothetical protein [Oscillospiraceae bacterium]
MTDSGSLIARLTGLLREAGLSAYSEFERNALPLPADTCFVTVGIANMQAERSIGGSAIPVSLKLRVRVHTKTGVDASVSRDTVQTVLAALSPGNDPYPAAEISAPVYQKQLDRLVTELNMQLDGLLTEAEGGV